MADKFGRGMLGFYKAKGLVREAADAAAAAQLIGCQDAGALAATLQQYTAAAHSGSADEFGKVTFPVSAEASTHTLCYCFIAPAARAGLTASALISALVLAQHQYC